jgi:hypothetical protein
METVRGREEVQERRENQSILKIKSELAFKRTDQRGADYALTCLRTISRAHFPTSLVLIETPRSVLISFRNASTQGEQKSGFKNPGGNVSAKSL